MTPGAAVSGTTKVSPNWYAYVNNDPVNYVDPLGLRPLSDEERALLVEALGTSYGGVEIDLDQIQVEDRAPTVKEVRDAAHGVGIDYFPESDAEIQASLSPTRPISLPDDTIYFPPGNDNAAFVHEGFLQYQYQAEGAADVFVDLLEEQREYKRSRAGDPMAVNPCDYPSYQPDPSSLGDIGYYEGQARYVENFARGYHNGGDVAGIDQVPADSGLSSQSIGSNFREKN